MRIIFRAANIELARCDRIAKWSRDGEIHREDGPAVIHFNGNKEWRKSGKLHRDNDPAIIWPNGARYWWSNGHFIRKSL